MEGSKHRWQAASSALRNRDPYCFKNFKHALSRVKGYVGSMKECGVNWLGLKFKFPLIWWSTTPYNMDFSLTRAEEQRCWQYWVTHRGFLKTGDKPEFPFNFLLSTNRAQCRIQILSEAGCCMRTCNRVVGGRC